MKLGETIANRIKYFLEKKNITQCELAKLAEIPNCVLSLMLQGKCIEMRKKLFVIIKILDISISEFFDDDSFDYSSIDI